MSKILLVEDDRNLAANVKEWLEFEHYLVELAETGSDGLDLLKAYPYDLVILDVNLPRMSGLEVCREYRDTGGQARILMLTGQGTLTDKEAGFQVGVDDYLTKPFHMKELSMRIKALLRRPADMGSEQIKIGNLLLDKTAAKLTRNGQEIHLQRMDFMLLAFLMSHPGQIFSPEALLESVWSSESERSSDTIRTSIRKLRTKIDEEGKDSIIKNVHGVGYKVEAP